MENTYRISELAARHGLTRGTLLHYDHIGLLSPSGRDANGYRRYTAADLKRLEQICRYRASGLSLEEIGQLMNENGDVTAIMEKRLQHLASAISELQLKERLLKGMLKTIRSGYESAGLERQTWLELKQACGQNEAAIKHWHRLFELRTPQAHHEFLLSLGLSEKEVLFVRYISKNPQGGTMQYFYELFEDLPRQGPGCAAATVQALAMLEGLPDKPAVLDIGCGCGLQTLILAERLNGPITAIDNHLPVLRTLEDSAQARGLRNLSTQAASMFDLPFAKQSFDLIWAEGSIFIIGIEKGLSEWREYLKPGGFLAFTEMCWLTDNPPQEIRDYIARVYPVMLTIDACRERIRQAGYRELGNFTLPESAWWDDYYTPMLERLAELKISRAGIAEAQAVYSECEEETAMYRKHSASYGYVFFVLQA